MVDKNDSFLREVEDELRSDQLRKLWNTYGTYVIGAVIAFVLSIGVYQQVKSQRLAANQEAGARFEAARNLASENKMPEAAAALDAIAKTGPAGYATLARFQQAAALVKAGKSAEAVALYDAVASNPPDDLLRDIARLQAASLRLDGAAFAELETRLTPLTDERNAFRATAREYLGLAARKAGKADQARKLFLQVLGDSKASKASKDRVSSYLSGIAEADLAKPAAASGAEPAKPAAAVVKK
jgi:hypothetical protein